ncbi:hypothetical protein HYQ46_000495 [Verticillium longisporum]|nr:hypothetical protein HYQ46_000495 [Verticillium longisporum]
MIEWPSLGFHYPIFAKEKLQRLQRRPSPGGVNMRAGERVSPLCTLTALFSHTGQLWPLTQGHQCHPCSMEIRRLAILV